MGVPTLRIRLLGEFDLRCDDAALPLPDSGRAVSLLAFLLLRRGTPQPRQRLAFLLWPDSTESQARTNLRHVLHTLRRNLSQPERYLDVTPRTIGWRADAPFWLDVAGFEEALSRADEETADAGLSALQGAVASYGGELLEGCYDEWVLEERDWLHRRYLEALERLAGLLEARGAYAEAIRYAERLLRHDPLREGTYRMLMRLHDARGDRARALRVYHASAAILERELGVEPSMPTREAYEALLRAERGPARAPAARGGRAHPLVGRTSEWARLTTLWRTSEAGRAQVVLLSGEPGIGKTRLVEELRSWCLRRGATTAEARSYAAEGAPAYGPVVSWLRSEAVEAHLRRLDRARLAELARLLPELLSEVPGLAAPGPLSGDDHRQRLFDAVARALLATGRPLLLVADDLHWADRETLQFLHYLLRLAPKARLLVAATARREEINQQDPLDDLLAGLQTLELLTEIELGRLTREETSTLAGWLTGQALEYPVANRLYGETEGNPLFVVEALRAGWEGGDAGRMSAKVRAVILSRLGQLSPAARELAGIAATVGRGFTADVLGRASQADEETLVRGLDELWRRRIIREQDADAYDFSHDKIREVAYLHLSPAQRRLHHLRIARALERLHGPSPASGPVAAHYERAGATDDAIAWYGRAADAARQLHANVEAVRLLDRAVDLLRTLPRSSERDVRELAILSTLAAPVGGVEGFSSERLDALHRRALELARALGVEPPPPLIRSLAVSSLSRSDFGAAQRFGERLHARGERNADEMLLVEGEYVLGIAAFWHGEFDAARRHFEAAVEAHRPEHRPAHLSRFGLDPKVVCLSRLANTLWFLGRPGAATRSRDAALALAEEIRHPDSRATALVFAAILAVDMRDPESVRACAASLDDGLEHQWRPTRVHGAALRGYVTVLDGQTGSGIARIQHALDRWGKRDHAPGMRASLLRLLLEACATAGDAPAGLAAAGRALELGGAVRVWEAEVRRLRAGFLAKLGASAEEVEAELGLALTVARNQRAKMFEVRILTSLFHHRASSGDGPGAREARDDLERLLDGLPEGEAARGLPEAAVIIPGD